MRPEHVAVWHGFIDDLRDAEYEVWNGCQSGHRQLDATSVAPTTRRRVFAVAVRKGMFAEGDAPEWPCLDEDVSWEDSQSRPFPPVWPCLDTDPDTIWPAGMVWPDADFRRFSEPQVQRDGSIVLGRMDPSKYPDNNRVFDPKGPCPTLRAQYAKCEPPGRTTNLWLVNGQVRNLSVQECLRIHGFPAEALEGVPTPAAYKMVGDSVCVPVARGLLRTVIRLLS